MKWQNFKLAIQIACLLPVIGIFAYIGFWFTFIIGPVIVGAIIVVVVYYLITEMSRSNNEEKEDKKE